MDLLKIAGSTASGWSRILRWRAGARWGSSVVGDAPVVVSLTSYGKRISTVAATIESIAAGNVRPRRLILWLSNDDLASPLPRWLELQRKRGLEIIGCDDYLSHKKYYPYATESTDIALPLVTADDDVLYPRWWLQTLVDAHHAHPHNVVGLRSKVVSFTPTGEPRAYNDWRMNTSTKPAAQVFMTGVSGVLYPIPVLHEARRYGDDFMNRCPRGDDLWLHRSALRANMFPLQASARAYDFPSIPKTQRTSLMSSNLGNGGNDAQFRETYEEEDLKILRGDAQ